MTLYTRPQLALLLVIVGAGGLGLGVGHWRRAHPELAERIEGLDRDPGAASEAASTGSAPKAPGRPAARPRRAVVPPPPTGAPAELVDVNRASADDLVRLPGIGPTLAARIVAARELQGPFTSIDDLRRVRGLAAAKIDRFRALVTVARAP